MSTTLPTFAPHGAASPTEESRALLGASAISAMLGVLWVLLVLFGPRGAEPPTLLSDPEREQVAVTFAAEVSAPTKAPVPEPQPVPRALVPAQPARVRPAPADQPAEPRVARPARARSDPARDAAGASDPGAAFGGAFATGANTPVGDVRGVLRGVQVSGSSSGAVRPGKAALRGADDAPAGTPGRGRLGTADGASIGAVAAGSGVARAAVRVSTPRPVGSTASGLARGDGAQLGTVVRGRESQLRFCYVESGLRVDPGLAGSVTLAVTLEPGGSVTTADVTRRSWSGEGAAAAEACILQKVRAWRFPARAGGGTYEFSFSFTR